ncbi:hypothetical protein [Streptomyces sp. N2A]|uniref:hypothetical protein n=1 Tax=Streptomyces sp. N2A TaxID=3073936 RepID=UPI0028700776|nr:hypothetical protein [Streptomyces sp. N2A]
MAQAEVVTSLGPKELDVVACDPEVNGLSAQFMENFLSCRKIRRPLAGDTEIPPEATPSD